jgi:hypothetical protein
MFGTSPTLRESGQFDREVTLNDFMSERSGTQAELQNLIDRMFDGA